MRTIYIVIPTPIDRRRLHQLLSELKAFWQSRGGSVSKPEQLDRHSGPSQGGAECDNSSSY